MKNLILFVIVLLTLAACSNNSIVDDSQVNLETEPTVEAASISGVNWADARDNFVSGWVIPSGLSAGDSYATVTAKTESVLNEFSSKLKGVNTIRIPINPPSVLDSWWANYKGVIDRATAKNFKVIIACWESDLSKDGRVDDITKFWQMWDKVVSTYSGNSWVYYEVFNEPHGYTSTDLRTLYKEFLDRYERVPRGRIVLGGIGYSEDVKPIGSDSRFNSCLLSLHNYAFWAKRSVTQWTDDWRQRIGIYGSRTIITEFGVAMSTGKDYQNGDQTDNEIAFTVATSNVCRTDKIASVYWPGLRDGDYYSLFTRGGTGSNITLNPVNNSGIFRVRYGWGL